MSVQANEYHLPFMGRWFVMQGGDTPNVNHHMDVVAQWYGLDHTHVQDTPILNQGEGQNLVFNDIHAEFSEMTFEHVDWPLIRGLFVWKE